MIDELKRGRGLLGSIYAMDEKDQRAKDESIVIMAKASSEILELQKANEKLKKFIRRNIS